MTKKYRFNSHFQRLLKLDSGCLCLHVTAGQCWTATSHAERPSRSTNTEGRLFKLTILTNNFKKIITSVTRSKAVVMILTQSTECARSRRPSWQSPRLYWSHVDSVNTRHRSATSLHLLLLLLLRRAGLRQCLIVAVCRQHYTRVTHHHQCIP